MIYLFISLALIVLSFVILHNNSRLKTIEFNLRNGFKIEFFKN